MASRKINTAAALLAYMLIALMSGLAATVLTAGIAPDIDQSRKVGLFVGVVVVPFVETFILLTPTAFAALFTPKINVAASAGALPLSLFHVVLGWLRAVFIWPQMAWLSYCYLKWRLEGVSIANAAVRVWFIHAFGNLLALVIIQGNA